MKKLLFQLLLVIAIAFSPVGQAMVVEDLDQMDMSSMMDDCVECGQHQDMTQNTCMEGNCFTDSCLNTSASSFFLYLDPVSSVNVLDPSSLTGDIYRSRYRSQISLPPYRPPIA